MTDFEAKTLAELHSLAGKAGIDGFRRLRREDLIDKLDSPDADGGDDSASGGGGSEGDGPVRPRRRRSRGGRDRGGRGDKTSPPARDRGAGEKNGGGSAPADDAGSDLTEASGVLEILSRGSGLLRLEGDAATEAHVSPAQIRRCQLRTGDKVTGPMRPARRGERRPSLVRIETVNGAPPEDDRAPGFDSLTPITPNRHIPLKSEPDDILARSVDLLAPLAFGQRVLVEAQPRSGRTSFLKSLAGSIASGSEDPPAVIVLLVDERPEEVTAWTRSVPGVEIAAAAADLGASDQIQLAERTLAKVKRRAEAGEDVVIIVDSLTRLGSAYGDASAIKPFFGTGREIEEESAGSVTVIATALWGSPGDQEVMDAVRTTENATIRLDTGLAAEGIVPAIDLNGCGISGQEAVLDEEGLAGVRKLRAELKEMEPEAAANRLAELIKGSAGNEELLRNL